MAASIFERRVPAVYVEVEDYSYLQPELDSGRSVFGVIVSDRGRHNSVVRINSVPQFIRLFGKPNIDRHGQMHYQIEKALQYTSDVFVIRASLVDSDIEAENAAIANCAIKYNSPTGSDEQVYGKFIFTNSTDSNIQFGTDLVSKYVFCNKISWEQFKVGDYIFSALDDRTKALKVVAKDQFIDGQDKYYLQLEVPYTGTTDVDQNNANALLVAFVNTLGDNNYSTLANYNFTTTNSFVAEFAYQYFPGVEPIANATYLFTNGSNIVIASDVTSYDAIKEERWIFPVGELASLSRQIIRKDVNDLTGDYELILNEAYTGPTSLTPQAIKQYIPFEIISQVNVRETANFDSIDTDNLFYFKAVGTGTYYNRLFIRGIRNLQYEKLYQTGTGNMTGALSVTEESPENIYKYSFMDITVNQMNEDGTTTVLEGPWTVSLLNRVNRGVNGIEGETVIDPYTGRQLYLPFIINTQSQFIECIESNGAETYLSGSDIDSETRRLQVMSLLSEGDVVGSTVRGTEGFFLQNGEDGALYNAQGRVQMQHGRVKGSILRAYNGTLPSADPANSIQKIIQEIYPKYKFDYVLSGGYSAEVQKAASDLVWMRQSMLLLADTGGYKISVQEDLDARLNDVPWNNWSAALYTQYRKVFDPYTGKRIWITPIYHAIERHLRTDRDYWIAEPVAGIEKGMIEEPIELSYNPSVVEIGDLIEAGMNPTIDTTNGKHFIEELSTWKRFSKLRNLYVVKFIHYLRQVIPPLLLDILFRKADAYWINQANRRLDKLMAKYSAPSGKYAAVKYYKIDLYFDDDTNILFVNIIMQPIGVIKKIHVTIKVGNPNG